MGNKLFQETTKESQPFQSIKIFKKTLQIAVNPPFLTGKSSNIFQGLNNFFEKSKNGLIKCGELKLFIWRKSKLNFFVYDPNGRNNLCQSNVKGGLPCLITLQNLTNVFHLLSNLSDLKRDNLFEISEICLEKMETENFKTDYRILNNQKAVLTGKTNNEIKSTFVTSVVSIIYTKISPSNEWKSKTIDQICCLGNSIIEHENLNIENFPNFINFGKYSAELNIKISVQTGIIVELLKALKFVFQSNENFILEISDVNYSIWKFNDLFYLFIPTEYKIEMHSSLSSLQETILKSFSSLEVAYNLHEIDLMKIIYSPEKYDHKCLTDDENLKFINLSSPIYSRSEILPDLKELRKSSNISVFCTEIIYEIIEKCIPNPIIEELLKADRIFPTTDLGHLKELRKNVIQGFDVESGKPDNQLKLSLSKELLIETNFIKLPDGSEIISGTTNFELIQSSELLTALTSILISHKYDVSTWDENVVDFVLTTALQLSDKITVTERHIFEKKLIEIPDMKLGSKKFQSSLSKICCGKFGVLRKMLEDSLNSYDRVLIIGSQFSAGVFQSNNFFYLFLGGPCDFVGFRNSEGFSCFIRFRTLNSLFLRILSNRGDFDASENVLICTVTVTEIIEKMFEERSESENEIIVNQFLKDREQKEAFFTDKLEVLNQEISSEISRRNLYGNIDSSRYNLQSWALKYL